MMIKQGVRKMKKSTFSIITRLTTTLLILTILATSTSFAQEKESQDTTAVKPKSEKFALTLSLVGTIVPFSILVSRWGVGQSAARTWVSIGGMFIGPALGYFYGGISGRGLPGIGVRSLCILSVIGGTYLAWKDYTPLAFPLVFGGIAVFFISSIRDIASVSRKVREHNEEIRNIALSIAPIIIPQKKTFGIGVQVQF